MRLIAVSMIRNEADILPDFLGHCAALFDEVLAVDHASSDGTSEMLAAAARRMPLTVYRLAHRAYVQSRIVTALAHEAFARGADWVFPLDADEFPMVAGRADLLARLPARAAGIEWRWRNLWPLGAPGFARFRAEGDYEALPEEEGGSVKVALSRRALERLPAFQVGTGSHNVPGLKRSAGALPEAGRLAHLPIRAPERFLLKARLGRAALEEAPGLGPRHGMQWRRAAERPERFAEDARLRRNALAYPLVPEEVAPAERLRFVPLGRIEDLPPGLPTPEAVLARDAAIAWRPLPEGVPEEAWHLVREGMEFVLAPSPPGDGAAAAGNPA